MLPLKFDDNKYSNYNIYFFKYGFLYRFTSLIFKKYVIKKFYNFQENASAILLKFILKPTYLCVTCSPIKTYSDSGGLQRPKLK